ncbi:Protein of unknown function [Tsukamurella pulmonis]|uniref:DUF2628 domain-containing protein n=1 Tax=Tsukamurella pulmonis TaxID=47312 RepID=A0A1H1HIX4_9ACTN|nr:DUF2628 domain-containing protein [Tsukamurella pulmonis]SDR25323.1 Protein of unknown function [Tsukamurella pulmonis]SUP14429.1 Protein of uncharacterised function (DUF2628) [Tsukamurella pulmonis]
MTDNGLPPQYPTDPQSPYGRQAPYPGQQQAPFTQGQQPAYGQQAPFGAQAPFPGQAPLPAGVHERWRSRFEFFGRYGQPASSPEATAAFKQLSFGERFRLGFNGPAFFFGPIYFAIKGPWRKGLSLFGISMIVGFLLSLVEVALNITFPAASYGIVSGLIFQSVANWAYFLHAARGSTSWNPFEGMPLFRKRS